MNADGSPQNPTNVTLTDEDIIKSMKDRMELAVKATGKSHTDALDDLKFLKGEQWPDRQRKIREQEGRPVLTVNKLPTFLAQVTNDQRQNKASIKVSAVSEDADNTIAEIVQGMVRHIEYTSRADSAYDTAKNSAAGIGFGYFRFVTEYESPTSFNQVIKIKRIRNPFTVYFDPNAQEIDGSDAEWVIITGKMTKKEFKRRYPSAHLTINAFDTVRSGDDSNKDWINSDDIRIAEYYFIERKKYMLYLLPDGRTVDKLAPGEIAVKKRETYKKIVHHCFCSPCEVLEKSQILASGIPVFPVYGSEYDLDGEVYRTGLIRNAKDPAMMYNFWMTSATEEIAMRPKTPYIGAKGQFRGEESRWKQANVRSYPYLEYEPVTIDGQLASPPARQQPADVPHGYLTMATHASDNIKATTGIYDSSLGAEGHATSGKQEIALQKQGSVANFHFVDNFFKTLRWAAQMLIEMIPQYYDVERMVLIRGEDDQAKSVTINKYDEAVQRYVNDIRTTQFAVAVSVGPSYSTMRAEAADAMVQFGQSWPKLMDIAGDKVVKAMNWPGADEIAERIKTTIPKEIRGAEDGDEEPVVPPEIQQELLQLRQQVEELSQEADQNHTKVVIEEIRKEATIAAANITAESRRDVEEIKGWVKLLVEQMQPPPVLESEVNESAASSSTVPAQSPAVQSQGPQTAQ